MCTGVYKLLNYTPSARKIAGFGWLRYCTEIRVRAATRTARMIACGRGWDDGEEEADDH
jgi:hypothetical protein